MLVGKFTSGLFRAAYQLSAAEHGLLRPFVSLDAPWCAHRGVFVCPCSAHAVPVPCISLFVCHATRHTRCADYGVVSGYNDDFPQRGLGDRGDEQVLPADGVPARGRPNRGSSAPVRDFNKNMFQC